MGQIINSLVTALNDTGSGFCSYAGRMFVQSSVLIILLLILDYLLRKRVRAVVRYCLWMLVFVKLILPPSFSMPTGIGYWSGDYLSTHTTVLERASAIVQDESVGAAAIEDTALSAEIPQVKPSHISLQTTAPITSAAPVLAGVSDSNALTWRAIVFLLWLAGVSLMSVLLIQRMWFVRGLVGQSEPVTNRLAEMLNQCRRQVGIRRNIELRLSNNVSSPAVCGLLKPAILIPRNLLEKLSRDKLKAVLIHELAHIRRGDLLVNSAQTILQIIYFYNPLVWLANAVVRKIREQAVDEMVLVVLEAGAKSYSDTLIDIAEMAFSRTNVALRLIGVVESKKSLERRIKHMSARPIPKSARLGLAGLLMIVLIGALLLPMAKADKSEGVVAGESENRQSQFMARLATGVTVELVGVCKHPSDGEQWWRPDATLLSEAPFDHSGDRVYTHGDREQAYDFAARFSNIPDGMYGVIRIDPSDSYVGGSLYSSVRKDGKDLTEYENGRLVSTLSHIATILDRERKKCTVRIGIADGQWETVFQAIRPKSNTWGTSSRGNEIGSVAFGKPIEQNGKTWITITHSIKTDLKEVRIVATNTNDNVIESSQTEGSGAGGFVQRTAAFDIPLAQVKTFRIQTRPYQWIKFNNVSLRPSVKTNVRVEVASGQQEDYSSVVVAEGAGFGDIIVGDTNCTGEFIESGLGPPDEEVKDQKTGWWLDYRKTYGLDFWLYLKENVLLEIRLNKGFKGKLTSGISMSSTKQDVFNTYGEPVKQNTVRDLTKHFDNQVLYGKKRLFLKPKSSKIFYVQHGLLFWFEGDKILQIVIHRKEAATDVPSEAKTS